MITYSTNKLQKVLLSGGCEQNGTPTPDTPMDIVCNNGVVKVKNLFNPSIFASSDSSTKYAHYQVPNGVYTMSSPDFPFNNSISNVFFLAGNVITGASSAGNGVAKDKPITITVTDGYYTVAHRTTSANQYLPRDYNWQIEKGLTATPYVPYGQIYTDGTKEVVTDNIGNTANAEMLLSIGAYKDTQSVLDGKVTRNIGIKVLDGTENWGTSESDTKILISGASATWGVVAGLGGFCTHLTVLKSDETTFAGACRFATDFNVYEYKTAFGVNSIVQFKQFLADQYAAGTPVIVVYPLATPTTEQVTPQPLAGNSVTQTAGSIDNLPIETSTIVKLKKRYIGDDKVGRVFIGNDKVWETDEWYGIRWCEETNVVERIGNLDLHRSLPLQSLMRRCMLQDDGVVYKYISSSNPLEYEDGTTAHYDGSDGQVMVEIPAYHHECGNEMIDGKLWNYIKLYPDVNLGVTSKKCYIGAFELIQDNSSNDSAKGCSVSVLDLSAMLITTNTTSVNAADVQYLSNAPTYRNYNYGNTDTTNVKCSYGRPTTNRNRVTFRSICARRGTNWSLQSWDAYNSLLRLYFVEYANFNSQEAFNSTLDSNGYKQGGLGTGVTNVSSNDWSSFNSYNPFIPCGLTIGLGNNTGVVSYVFATDEWKTGAALTTYVNSYRGIELPFGHIWKFIDGFNRQGGADNTEKIYICSDVSKFAENAANGYTLVSKTTGRASGNTGGIVLGEQGTFWPKPGGSTIYDDYFYNACANGTWYTLCSGGSSVNGSNAGLLCFYATSGASNADPHIGSRLLYTINNN